MKTIVPAIILFLVCVFVGSGARALTLADIETQVRRNVRDTATTGNRYTDAILLDWINDAQRDVVSLTWSVKKSTAVTLVAGTTFYSLPNDFLAADMVMFTRTGTSTIQLKEVLQGSYVDDYPDFERTGKGVPTNYFVRQSTSGANALEVAYLPVPTSSSTGTVRMDYFCYPDDMANDSDIPFNGALHLVPYHKILVDMVTARIKVIEGRVDEANFYQAAADRGLAVMSERVNHVPNYRPSIRGAGK